MKNIQRGFTLIELMIVVAIIAILAAIAISQYQDYVIRAQVSEGAALADGLKSALGEFYNGAGHYPNANASAGLAAPTAIAGSYVTQVDASNGLIKITYGRNANAKINNKILQYSSVTHAGSIEWYCKSDVGNLPQKWCPSSCNCKG